MLNKALRILIIDPNFEQSRQIEKMLNAMGYYGVAPTACMEEGLILNHYGMKCFDVLLAPEKILVRDHQTSRFNGFNIKNLFLYACTSYDHDITIRVKGIGCFKSGLPEYSALECFMASLSPPDKNRHPTMTP